MILQTFRPAVAFLRGRSAICRLYHAEKVATLGSQPDTQSPVYQVGQSRSLGLELQLVPDISEPYSATRTSLDVISYCGSMSNGDMLNL